MKKILTALCAAACAGAPAKPLPSFSTAANAEHPQYPAQRFITASGLGSSPEDADQRAKANVSARISAQLQSETNSFQQYSSKSGDTAEAVTSRVSVHSDFDRADLIAIVGRQQQGSTFYSFAALDRAAADRELGSGAGAGLQTSPAPPAQAHPAPPQPSTPPSSTP